MPFSPPFSSAPAGCSTGGASLGEIALDPLQAGGRIPAQGDAVRSPFISISFSILIPDALSSFFSFCAHRLFDRGASLGGIASNLLRAGGGLEARGDAVSCPLILLVSFTFLIRNVLSSFFSPWPQSYP